MWEVAIDLIDEVTERAHIVAKRTDPVTDEIYIYRCTAIITTSAQRTALLQLIKDKYIASLDRQNVTSLILGGLADTAVNALNAWEITR